MNTSKKIQYNIFFLNHKSIITEKSRMILELRRLNDRPKGIPTVFIMTVEKEVT